MAKLFKICFRYFPSQGEKTHIFATELQFPEELSKVDGLVSRMASQDDIITNVSEFHVSPSSQKTFK